MKIRIECKQCGYALAFTEMTEEEFCTQPGNCPDCGKPRHTRILNRLTIDDIRTPSIRGMRK